MVDEDTQVFGVGPFSFNVAMARRLGYSATEIGSAVLSLTALSRGFGFDLAQRLGMTRICEIYEQWTYQNKPCHLCQIDSKSQRKRNGNRSRTIQGRKSR